jgi:hypothetical protein
VQEKLEKNNLERKQKTFQLFPDFPKISFHPIFILMLSYQIWIKGHGQAYSKRVRNTSEEKDCRRL